MKLNYRRTVLVGMAFLSICAFWQLYDNVVPLILKNTFHMRDDVAGVIMAMDNVLALFMLPLFGKLSDGCHTRLGKRMPFIVGGTVVAVLVMNLLPIADKSRNLTLFVVALGVLLIAMGMYRSPAVALMPDVTPKPLRSKGNAIINLMGALGGVFTLGVTGFLVTKDAGGHEDFTWLFLAVALLMVGAVLVLLVSIRENKLARETALADAREQEPTAQTALPDEGGKGLRSLEPALRRSLMLILCSVFLWFMGYNAVTTAFTKYVSVQWGYDIKAASQCLMVATVGAVLSYLPVGMLSSRFGRKRMIQTGVLLLAACFTVAAFFQSFNAGVYVVFALVGAAWALINVNSYPMVVEISKRGDVGKFTGYYYTFSMAAQIVTPILSGWLLQNVGYYTLLPYAAIMVALSFVTITLTKHGDNRPEPPKSRLEAFDVGDD
ncbi:MAG: MFS transporter [Clostridia bacterium]